MSRERENGEAAGSGFHPGSGRYGFDRRGSLPFRLFLFRGWRAVPEHGIAQRDAQGTALSGKTAECVRQLALWPGLGHGRKGAVPGIGHPDSGQGGQHRALYFPDPCGSGPWYRRRHRGERRCRACRHYSQQYSGSGHDGKWPADPPSYRGRSGAGA